MEGQPYQIPTDRDSSTMFSSGREHGTNHGMALLRESETMSEAYTKVTEEIGRVRKEMVMLALPETAIVIQHNDIANRVAYLSGYHIGLMAINNEIKKIIRLEQC